MTSSRFLLLFGLFALFLEAEITVSIAATREPLSREFGTGNSARFDCSEQACSAGCWCPFDHWEEARLLKFGYGMTANREAAAYWYRRAAEKGDARAAFNYGFMLIHGIGTEPSPDEGARLLREAAGASVQEAWFELGNLHRLGRHLAGDPQAAIAAYRRAAESGHVRAQHALANMYGNGQGAGIDLVTAYKWWRLAARKGHELADQALRLATSMMTASEISLARRAADAWTAKKKKR